MIIMNLHFKKEEIIQVPSGIIELYKKMGIKIIVDSGCDMSKGEAAKCHAVVLPLKIMWNNEEYLDNVNMSHNDFYKKLQETDTLPKTSQISPFEYEEAFRNAINNGDEVLCITISSKLSGCFQSASIAAYSFDENIPIIDSLNVTIGQRLLVERASKLIDDGLPINEIVEILEREKNNIRIIAKLDTLENLKKGGRIGNAAAIAGSLLSIKPVITLKDGEITLIGKARGAKGANAKLTELINQAGGINFDYPYCLAYSGDSNEELMAYIESNKNLYLGKTDYLPVSSIGSAVGTHAGCGAIAAAFFVR